MIIIAWNGSGDLGAIFHGDVFLKVLSIFITAAILKLAQGNDSSTHTALKFSICSYHSSYLVQKFLYFCISGHALFFL